MKRLSEKELSYLIFIATFIFGAWLRFMPARLAGFPMNDGGMFLSMIQDLRLNHYLLPAFTTYNNLHIPFVYPPLPFYMAGAIADIFHLSDLQVLLWLPAVINFLTIPAFALLAGSLLKSPLKTSFASLLYMLTPLSMDWFLMGGGLTRGMGQLFLILTCWSVTKLFDTHARKYLVGSILFGALVVLSHPESALLTVVSAIILWCFLSRSINTTLDALLVGVGITLLISPWLFYTLHLHGITPFHNAMGTSGNTLYLWKDLFSFTFAQETGLALLASLGLIGLFIKLGRKEYLMPVWLALPFFINPRSASRLAIIPLAILATVCLFETILPAIQGNQDPPARARTATKYFFLSYILIYMLINGYILDVKMANNRLGDQDRLAMTWLNRNTPPESSFIILTGEQQMLRDPIQEWFPAIAQRRSSTTLQGLEWLWGGEFITAIVNFQGLQNCILQDVACLENKSQQLGLTFDHIYIKKVSHPSCPPAQTCLLGQTLIDQLRHSTAYASIYEDTSTVVFKQAR
jgi:hypothetical protein